MNSKTFFRNNRNKQRKTTATKLAGKLNVMLVPRLYDAEVNLLREIRIPKFLTFLLDIPERCPKLICFCSVLFSQFSHFLWVFILPSKIRLRTSRIDAH